MAKVIARNKDATFNYAIIETFEAGVVLEGWEVKALRSGNVSIKGAHAFFKNRELFVSDVQISGGENIIGANRDRLKKLLLHQAELKKIAQLVVLKGNTVVVLALKLQPNGLFKIDIALAKGKTHGDKREVIKARDHKRYLQKVLKGM